MRDEDSGWVKIAKMKDLLNSRGFSVRVGGTEVAVFRVDGELVAVVNDCPHQHFARLHDGSVSNGAITCPMHGWTFDLKSGAAVVGSGKLRHCAVRTKNGEIWLRLPGAGV